MSTNYTTHTSAYGLFQPVHHKLRRCIKYLQKLQLTWNNSVTKCWLNQSDLCHC